MKLDEEVEREKEEKAFAAFKKQYKKPCSYCGKMGHKSTELRMRLADKRAKRNQNGTSGTAGTNRHSRKIRYFCHKRGHIAKDCPELNKKIQSKWRPKEKKRQIWQRLTRKTGSMRGTMMTLAW